jgi:hypothetical protein
MNIADLEMRLSDLAREPFEPSEFGFRFLEIFDAPKSTIDKLRKGTQNKADIPGDLLWQRKFYYRPLETGETASAVDELRLRKPAKKCKPRFIIATDGSDLSALDTKTEESLHCDFCELNDHFDFFLPLAGIDKYQAVEENPADIKAAGRLAKFHDEIMRANPDWRSLDKRHALNQFMTRILFCLFSEDTGSFEADLFTKAITEFGGVEGEQLQLLVGQIFDTMNVPEDQRGDLPAHIREFPYVNGGLFADKTEVPLFSKRAKRVLIEAAHLDWKEINPDIFGSMIQAVVDESMRGDLGMHYTSVPNIMKVLQPLFLMSLEEEFADARDHREERAKLKNLLSRISKIRVFDPACGSGNFLIIAYRELRNLEMRIFQREDDLQGGQVAHRWESGIKLSNFFGIEMADFAAETAKLSLWIAEYQMNQRFKLLFGEAPPDFPLKEGGRIVHGNALRIDWTDVCPLSEQSDSETYVVGNPPYLGSRNQTDAQKEDMKSVCKGRLKSFKTLDYVACWYLKGADYCSDGNSQYAFVATNSICQGQQVPLLWPYILSEDLEISFAHLSFKWKNNAAKNAGVICIIVGIRRKSAGKKMIFDKGLSRTVRNISPYLIEMTDEFVTKRNSPLSDLMEMTYGNYPGDGNHLSLSESDKDVLLAEYPSAEPFIRRLYGAQEFLKGIVRYCIWISDEDLEKALSIPPIAERIERTRQTRLNSRDPGYNKLAERPHQYRDTNVHLEHTLVVPTISSERRNILPVGVIDDGGKPEISGPLILLVISVVDQYLLQSIAVGISPESCRPAIHVA